MQYTRPVTDIIRQRYSCRTYEPVPIEEAKRRQLEGFMS
jgi:hypothetical protein